MLELLCQGVVVDSEWESSRSLESRFLHRVACKRFGIDDASDACQGFDASLWLGSSDVYGETGVVNDHVFGIAGLDAGASHHGGVVPSECGVSMGGS